MGAVALGADVLIGFLDPGDAQHHRAIEILRPWLTGKNSLLLPASVYAEILVQPIRHRLDGTIDAFVADTRIQIVPIDRSIARLAATLRANHLSLRLPDALALATAVTHRAVFLTLDQRLQHVAERLQDDHTL